jgi:hypothetical protein
MSSQQDEWLDSGYRNGYITRAICITHVELTRPANGECQYLIELNMTGQPMPSQQFECATCQQLVIVHREISDDNRPICIACGKPMTRNDGLTSVDKN